MAPALFFGYSRARAPFWFERKVEIFEFRLLKACFDLSLEFVREFTLLFDGLEDCGFSPLQFREIGVSFKEGAELASFISPVLSFGDSGR